MEIGRAGKASLADTPRPVNALQVIVLLRLLPDPPVPEKPADGCCDAAPANDRDGTQALLMDTDEADHEDDDGADVLDDDGRVSDQGPEVVGFQARIPLQVLEKGRLVGVVVRVCPERSAFGLRERTSREAQHLQTYMTA